MKDRPLERLNLFDDVLDAPLAAHLRELRHWFHQNPDPSFKEIETAKKIVAELEQPGIRYEYSGTGHSVIASIDGKDPDATTVVLRAEMDALPGRETTGAPYASRNTGFMHACGHCAHMAMLLGAARLLARSPPPGPVRLVFQPAEEKGGGARVAINDGALDGSVTAQSDGFYIRIHR